MRKINGYDVLAGYYGFSNFGDDLFRDILSQSLSQEPWARLRISENRPGPQARYARNIRAIANILGARSLTLGGGSILGARPPFSIRHLEMAAVQWKSMTYTAIGVGLLENLKSTPKNMLAQLSWVGLRSEAEYLTLRQYYPHVHYMSDLAYAAPRILLKADIQVKEAAGNKEISIIPASVGQLGQAAFNRDYLQAWLQGNLGPYIARGKRIKILLLQPQNKADSALCKIFKEEISKLGDVRQFDHRDAVETLHEIASSAFIFTDRLHGGILAHVCGVPFRLSQHHVKCIDLLTDIQHPDISGPSYAADTFGYKNNAVEDWTQRQSHPLRRHAELANHGIEAWLAHLRGKFS